MSTFKFRAAAVLAATAVLAVPAVAQASGWTTVAKKSIRGAFSITAMSHTVNGAHGVRISSAATHGGASVFWTMACSRGFTIHSHGGTWNPSAGYHTKVLRTGFSGAAADCDVVLSFGPGTGGGRQTVAIQRS
jgi:hypothetical protein